MTTRRRGSDPTRSWPTWLEPLRPDELTRWRLRSRVRAGADPLLRRLRRGELWDVASSWASTLAPLAAAVTLALGWLALRATPAPKPETPPFRVDPLMGPTADDSPPPLLTGGSEPSAEAVLSAVLYERE